MLATAYTLSGDQPSLRKARYYIDWLLEHATRTDAYIGWGVPFAWKNDGLLLPPGTPIGHTTMNCGNSLLRFIEATGEKSLIQPLLSICEFFAKGLKKIYRSEKSLSLSYTPTGKLQVINVNADIASLLLRVGNRFDRADFTELALKLIESVLETQNSDGSWYYYAFDSIGKPSVIDNRHTAMVLSSLTEVFQEVSARSSLAERILEALNRGLAYYLEHLFTEEGLPKHFHNRLYPLDTYNFAQSIITLLDASGTSALRTTLRESADLVTDRLVSNLLQLMRNSDGSFLYMRERMFKLHLNSLRWSNAITATALIRYRDERLKSEAKQAPLGFVSKD